jgi:hypothetical protein
MLGAGLGIMVGEGAADPGWDGEADGAGVMLGAGPGSMAAAARNPSVLPALSV